MFYIIEKSSQLEKLYDFGDCFIRFIFSNESFHPSLTSLSLIYIHPFNSHKGYVFCLDHNESFKLSKEEVEKWLLKHTKKLFVLDKKQALYHFDYSEKLYDINFIEKINNDISINCINWYHNRLYSFKRLNNIIPISKHYEENELLYHKVLPIIKKFNENDEIYKFNNGLLTECFFFIEKNGIKIDKEKFISYYDEKINNPVFSIDKSKIYTKYNLYTTTGRPSNAFNNINFAALDKNDGERSCYIPENDYFIEFDFQGYHPRLAASLVGFNIPKDQNVYEYLKIDKKEMFENLYGGIREKHINEPYFKEINIFINDIWDTYHFGTYYNTPLRTFKAQDNLNKNKLFNYILQAKETHDNVTQLQGIINLLKNKKTKLVLYTYDAFLFDYSKEDGDELLLEIKNTFEYPTNIKQGTTYQVLEKI